MARNLTLKLSEDILRETRKIAADEEASISGWVGKLIESEIARRKGFIVAKKRDKISYERVKAQKGKIARDDLYE